MARVLLMRLDAPLISFGGVSVDNYGYTEDYPALSMIAGLLANALGYRHREADRLQRLQNRLRMASRCDRPGERLVDYQTVDLGQELISDALGWTTRGKMEHREGAFSTGTHIRYRHYLADSVHTIALCLEPEAESPTLDDLAEALQLPARPLFIGRKWCIPSTPLFLSITDAASPLQALESLQRIGRRGKKSERLPLLSAWWDPEMGEGEGDDRKAVPVAAADLRDWANQVHTGRRLICRGSIDPPDGGQS